MKMRNKGKVHPFSSSSSSSSSPSPNTDTFPVLKLLPAAILALVSILSLEDNEVLAYMITRSLKSPAEDKKKSSKKQSVDGHGHKSPALFDCDCFHCYTSFWFRWDSSPNRELIHQAIEAFEDHLNNGEQFKTNGKNKRKDKVGRAARKTENTSADASGGGPAPENQENRVVVLPVSEVTMDDVEPRVEVSDDDAPAPAVEVRTHKGLARKVLPDVMGIFSSRLWSLWSPNV